MARERGLHTRATLRSRCTRLLPDVYVSRGTLLTPHLRALAAASWARGAGVRTGWSAAAVSGARWVPAGAPAELTLPIHARSHPDVIAHQFVLHANEIEDVDGVMVTTPERSAYDLGRRLPLVQAVAAVDELCALGVCGPERVAQVAAAHPGDRGLLALTQVLALVDPGAGSPWETHLRVLLMRAGLPRPRTQADIRGPDGRFLARADLCWPEYKIIGEYEGAQHRSGRQFTRDIDRYNELQLAGWSVVRVTAEQLTGRPQVVIDRFTRALHQAGARW